MILELNDKAIYDEMLALTGLRRVMRAGTADEEGVLLTTDMLPGLRNMARLMFAETVMELSSLAEGCEMDEEDVEPQHPYEASGGGMVLRLKLKNELTSGLALAAKRQCEHIVAAKVLEALAAGCDVSFATMLHREHRMAVEALKGVLEEAAGMPGRIEPRWW